MKELTKITLRTCFGLLLFFTIGSCEPEDNSEETLNLINGTWIYQDVNSSTVGSQQAIYDSWVGRKLTFKQNGDVTTVHGNGNVANGVWEWGGTKETLIYNMNDDFSGTTWTLVELTNDSFIVTQNDLTFEFSH